MPALTKFDPPAFMDDLDRISGGAEAWDRFMDTLFSYAIDAQQGVIVPTSPGGQTTIQFFSPKSPPTQDAIVEQAVTWNAFPKELLVRFGRARALIEADRLWPIDAYHNDDYDPARPGQAALDAKSTTWYRPHNEYCEWRVERDALTGQIRKVTFTSEPPEYWQAMFGGVVQVDIGVSATFPGDPEVVLDLYRKLVSPDVQMEDLVYAATTADGNKGDYNLYNKWNSTHGIAHLSAPPNSLGAEVRLGADATILRGVGQQAIQKPDALVCCSDYGGPERNSDPTIGATVNALARAGGMVTLVNPVGLYMDHIDISGWTMPDGVDPKDCIKILRGKPGYIERLVVEMPEGARAPLANMTIGGEPLRYGGQIAECITVKLVGGATALGTVHNGLSPCKARCCVDPANADRLRDPISWDKPTPIGFADALLAIPPIGISAPHSGPAKSVSHAHTALAQARPLMLRGRRLPW
jgi:hypothetical protein